MLIYESSNILKVPVKINGGEISYLYGNELPEIKDGTVGELLLPDYSIMNYDIVDELQKEYEVDLFDKDEDLMIILRNVDNYVKGVLEPYNEGCFDPLVDGRCVCVTLAEPLVLCVKGTKKATLSGGACKFELADIQYDAISLNNAYTMISEILERKRKSHTGNVFDLCYYYEWEAAKWRSLNVLRNRCELQYHNELVFNNSVFTIGNRYKPNLQGEKLRIIEHVLEFGKINGRDIKYIISEQSNYNNILDEMLQDGLIRVL